MRLLPLLTVLLLAFGLMACDTIIDDTIDPIDSAADTDLNSADDVGFLINGIIARSNNVHDNMTVQTSLMSDQFIFGGAHGGGATFPTFRDIMRGLPPDTNPLNNNSVDGTQNHLGQYRFLADNLLRRLDEAGIESEAGRYAGNFHGGMARYYWATYFAALPGTDQEGGGVISDLDNPADPERGEFISSGEMYQLALEKFEAAEPLASDYQQRLINSMKARIHLFQNDLPQAAEAAANGLAPGDPAFQNTYVDRAGNQANVWQGQGGVGRAQAVPAPRFFYSADYLGLDFNSPESARIPLLDPAVSGIPPDFGTVTTAGLLNREATHPLRFDLPLSVGDDVALFVQGIQPENDSPINIITWQENHLMLAELAQRGATSGDPLALVNEVRASYGIDDLSAANFDGLNTIFTERDKVTFATGIRLPDQRRATRFGLDSSGLNLDVHGWHLSDDVWWYLPITLAERNNNPDPNLPTELPD